MPRRVLVAVAIAVVAACSGCRQTVDQAKFEGAYRAGKALQVEVQTTGGVGPRSADLLKQFQTEVATLDGRARNEAEMAALAAYKDAIDAYSFFLRLRFLDYEAVNGRVLMMMNNLVSAKRYGLVVTDEKENAGWTDSGVALRSVESAAAKKMGEAERLINGR
jgi:hypothetical protein